MWAGRIEDMWIEQPGEVETEFNGAEGDGDRAKPMCITRNTIRLIGSSVWLGR